LKLTNKGRETIEKMHLISGLKKADIRTFFESMFTLSVLDYLEKENTHLPFIGSLSIEYIKEKYDNNLKSAQLKVIVEPDDDLERNIGQIVDGDTTDIEQIFEKRIQASLDLYLE